MVELSDRDQFFRLLGNLQASLMVLRNLRDLIRFEDHLERDFGEKLVSACEQLMDLENSLRNTALRLT